jgi:hypothetical protein
LASRDDLIKAAAQGTVHGNWREYDQHQTGGPWNAKMYLAGAKTADTAATQQLREDIAKYGWEAVEELGRRRDPKFRIPDVFKVKAESVTEGEPVSTTAKRKAVAV